MKRDLSKTTSKTEGVNKTHKYTVNDTNFILNTLADSLYQNPIRAILRELGCNAYDAHKRVGKEDEPFIVNLPTKLDTTFAIRDFGVSMTEQEFLDYYVAIGESDKRDTNEEDGTYGIGSKSPFSYVDTYNVTVYKDGKKRMYFMRRNDERIPVADEVHTCGTDEPDGVKIHFDVNRSDIGDFHEEAGDVYRWFDTTPNFVGSLSDDGNTIDIDTSKPNITISGDGWEILESTGLRSTANYVVMGNVAYDLDIDEFNNPVNGVILYVDIGDVEPTPNRQQLKYSDETKEVIKDKFDQIRDNLQSRAEDTLAEADSYREAKAIYANEFQYSNRIYKVPWGDTVIKNGEVSTPKGCTIVTPAGNKIEPDTGWRNDSLNQTFTAPPLVVLADNNYAKYVKSEKLARDEDRKVIVVENQKQASEICDKLKLDQVDFRVSNLEKPETSSTSSSSEPSSYAKADWVLFDADKHSHRNKNYWSCTETPEQAYYVVVSRYKFGWTKRNRYRVPSDLKSKLEMLKKLGWTPSPVMGVKPASLEDVPETWTPLKLAIEQFREWMREPVINELVDDVLPSFDEKSTRYSSIYDVHPDDVDDDRFKKLYHNDNSDLGLAWSEFFTDDETLTNKREEYKERVKTLTSELKNDYPLLKEIIRNTSELVTYINLKYVSLQ